MRTRSIVVAAAACLFVVSSVTQSHAVLTNGCSVAKMRAATKAFACVTREFSKEARGKTIDLTRCNEKLTGSFVKAESKGGCPTIGDAATAIGLVTDAADAVFADLQADTVFETEIPCLLAKVKTTVRYAKCESAAIAKRLGGTYLFLQNDFSNCGIAHSNAFDFAESRGSCATTGDSRNVRNSAGGGYSFLPNVNWGMEFSGLTTHYVDWAELPNAYLVNDDLSEGYFYQANLAGADLTGANLFYSRWSYADLSGADLTGADLSQSTITDTILLDANLGTTDLTALRAYNLTGCPASLPGTWQCRGNFLVGPTARLEFAEMDGLELSGTDLSGAVLEFATLTNANLAGISLVDASLRYAKFNGADLSGADLTDADASQTEFNGADLTGADFTNTDLSWAKFDGANLTGADLSTANLYGVHATGLLGCPALLPADWQCISGNLVGPNAYLADADLSGLDFSGLNLDSILFVDANLTGANFAGTNLSSANMDGANLTGVDLSTATLTDVRANLLAACPAVLPAGWGCVASTLVGQTANIRQIDFTGLDFGGLDLTGALFWFCELNNATFAGATLTDVDWYNSTCPDGFATNSTTSCCGHLIDVPATCTP